METNKVEIAAVRETIIEKAVIELNELELAMVGGGTGDVQLG